MGLISFPYLLCSSENPTTSLSNKREEFKDCFKEVTAAIDSKEKDSKVLKTRPRSKSHVLENDNSENSGPETPKTPKVSNNKTKSSLGPEERKISLSKRLTHHSQSSKKEQNKVNVKGETPLQIVARQVSLGTF